MARKKPLASMSTKELEELRLARKKEDKEIAEAEKTASNRKKILYGVALIQLIKEAEQANNFGLLNTLNGAIYRYTTRPPDRAFLDLTSLPKATAAQKTEEPKAPSPTPADSGNRPVGSQQDQPPGLQPVERQPIVNAGDRQPLRSGNPTIPGSLNRQPLSRPIQNPSQQSATSQPGQLRPSGGSVTGGSGDRG